MSYMAVVVLPWTLAKGRSGIRCKMQSAPSGRYCLESESTVVSEILFCLFACLFSWKNRCRRASLLCCLNMNTFSIFIWFVFTFPSFAIYIYIFARTTVHARCNTFMLLMCVCVCLFFFHRGTHVRVVAESSSSPSGVYGCKEGNACPALPFMRASIALAPVCSSCPPSAS